MNHGETVNSSAGLHSHRILYRTTRHTLLLWDPVNTSINTQCVISSEADGHHSCTKPPPTCQPPGPGSGRTHIPVDHDHSCGRFLVMKNDIPIPLPCPFCGEHNIELKHTSRSGWEIEHSCGKGFNVCTMSIRVDDQIKTVNLWNRRRQLNHQYGSFVRVDENTTPTPITNKLQLNTCVPDT